MTNYADIEAKLRKARRDLVDALAENEELELETQRLRLEVCRICGASADPRISGEEEDDE
jgi:hypothetical protein